MTTPTHVSGTIKPLEWERVGHRQIPMEHMTTCRTYKIIQWLDDSGHVLWFGKAGSHVRVSGTARAVGLDALKAVAQADYDARILAAIQTKEEYYITITKSDGIIQGLGVSREDSENDARLWTDNRPFTTYLCTKELYDAVKVYGGDTAFFLSPLGRAFYNGVMT